MDDLSIHTLYNRWVDMNNIISEEEIFDVEIFNSLFADTQAVLEKEERPISKSDDGQIHVMFTSDEVMLLLELSRFCYKEVVVFEQLQAQEQVYEFIYQIV